VLYTCCPGWLPRVELLSNHSCPCCCHLFVLQLGVPSSLMQLDVNKHGSSKEALLQLALH
jgi:hypothetical protein